MRFVKLTSITDNKPVYINIEQIGHFYQESAKIEYGKEKEPAHTRVGVATHNNGGFKIAEDIEQILKLIEKARGI
jgi:hypothetical protein